MKVQGKIIETLTVEKAVEVDVPEELAKASEAGDLEAQQEIEDLLRKAAYEATIFADSDKHGWEAVDTHDVEVLLSGAK